MSLKSWKDRIKQTVEEVCDPEKLPRYDETLVRLLVYKRWPNCDQTFMVSIVKHGKDYWLWKREENARNGHNRG